MRLSPRAWDDEVVKSFWKLHERVLLSCKCSSGAQGKDDLSRGAERPRVEEVVMEEALMGAGGTHRIMGLSRPACNCHA